MKNSMKSKLSKVLGYNTELNKKALTVKKSWDEVENLLKTTNKGNKKK